MLKKKVEEIGYCGYGLKWLAITLSAIFNFIFVFFFYTFVLLSHFNGKMGLDVNTEWLKIDHTSFSLFVTSGNVFLTLSKLCVELVIG